MWVFNKREKAELAKIAKESFLDKGVKAVVFGIYWGAERRVKYAIFVQDGFLVEEQQAS